MTNVAILVSNWTDSTGLGCENALNQLNSSYGVTIQLLITKLSDGLQKKAATTLMLKWSNQTLQLFSNREGNDIQVKTLHPGPRQTYSLNESK